MADSMPESLMLTIGKLESAVENFNSKVESIERILNDIKKEIKDSSKLVVANQYRLDNAEKDIQDLKDWKKKLIAQTEAAQKRRNNWWDSLTNKIIAAALIAVIFFFAGEYTKNLEYKTPPNYSHSTVKS